MKWAGKQEFKKAGRIIAIVGFVISALGIIFIRGFPLGVTYYSDLYWIISIQLFGLAMIIFGAILVTLGYLRTE